MNEGRIFLGMFVAAVVVMLGIAVWLSQLLGAAVAPTFQAVFYTAIACSLILVGHRALIGEWNVTALVIALCLMVSFPWWWPVLDSIAIGGSYPSAELADAMRDAPWNNSWINSQWFQWGTEVALIVLTVAMGYRELHD